MGTEIMDKKSLGVFHTVTAPEHKTKLFQGFGSVEKIKERGLDVPQVTELCHELKKSGFDIPDCVLTEEECVNVLEELLKGGAQNG